MGVGVQPTGHLDCCSWLCAGHAVYVSRAGHDMVACHKGIPLMTSAGPIKVASVAGASIKYSWGLSFDSSSSSFAWSSLCVERFCSYSWLCADHPGF
jgi:hypothetical protein